MTWEEREEAGTDRAIAPSLKTQSQAETQPKKETDHMAEKQMSMKEVSETCSRHLISAVNPRLTLYTRAGGIAATILVLNYIVIAAAAVVLVTESCSEVTTTESSEPETSGHAEVHESWMNKTLQREKVVLSGGVTVTTTVSGCSRSSMSYITSPMPDRMSAMAYGYDDNYGGIHTPELWEGTSRLIQVPCWWSGLQCWPGRVSDFSDIFSKDIEQFGCSYYAGQAVSHANETYSYTGRTAPFRELGNAMGRIVDRFPWCSSDLEKKSRERYIYLLDMQSKIHNTANGIALALYCGDPTLVAPAGVVDSLLDRSATATEWEVEPSFTQYWSLDVTTTTRTCPTFPSAFGTALAYASQIEVLITIALILAARKVGLIKDVDETKKTKVWGDVIDTEGTLQV